jgi:hypothetical protein
MIKKQSAWKPNLGRPHHRHTLYQLSYDGELEKKYFYWTYKVTLEKVRNKIVCYKRNSGVSAPNILVRKSEEGPLPYWGRIGG